MFVVYAIESCSTGRVYIGQSQDFDGRLKLHNGGHVKSTMKECPWRQIAQEGFDTREEARWREQQLKKSRGRRIKWLADHKL